MPTASKATAAQQSKPISDALPSAGSTEQMMLDILRDMLAELGSHRAARTVSLYSSLDRDLGLGSLERVELLVRCESRFRTRLPDEISQEADTPADWVRAVRGAQERSERNTI